MLSPNLTKRIFFLAWWTAWKFITKHLAKVDPLIKSFLNCLSAFLNACYSSLAHLEQELRLRKKVSLFKKAHQDFYAHSSEGSKGGWRTQAVHFRPVDPGHDGYIPPPGDRVIIRFREKISDSKPGEANLNFTRMFYFYAEQPQNSICDLCAVHSHALQEFIRDCEGFLAS